jgi:hypothetical protein
VCVAAVDFDGCCSFDYKKIACCYVAGYDDTNWAAVDNCYHPHLDASLGDATCNHSNHQLTFDAAVVVASVVDAENVGFVVVAAAAAVGVAANYCFAQLLADQLLDRALAKQKLAVDVRVLHFDVPSYCRLAFDDSYSFVDC